jgi:hypothetical protein
MTETATVEKLTGIALVTSIEADLKSAMSSGNMQECVWLSEGLTKARKLAATEILSKANESFVEMGKSLLDRPMAEILNDYEEPNSVSLEDIIVDYFEQAEAIVGDKASLTLHFSRDFTKPFVGFMRIQKNQAKSASEAHEPSSNPKINSVELLKVYGEVTITAEMASNKYTQTYVGLTFTEATAAYDREKSTMSKSDKGNTKYQLGLLMARQGNQG